MHRRYLSCSIPRCASLPRSPNSSEIRSLSTNSPTATQFYPSRQPSKKKKKVLVTEQDRFLRLNALPTHRYENLKPIPSDRRPVKERKLPDNYFPIVNATSYKLLKKAAFPSKSHVIKEPSPQDLKAMLEKHEARAMMLNAQKTPDPSDLGLSDEPSHDMSFAPGTFVEARRFVLYPS